MEQIKEKITMVNPVEGEATHLDAHNQINKAITQFYKLFDEIVTEYNNLMKKYEDTENNNFVSFSNIKDDIQGLKDSIQSLDKDIKELNNKIDEERITISRRYNGIVDTDKETKVELDPITDEDMKGKKYLMSVVINEALPNQGAEDYSFPKTSLVEGEYTPVVYLKSKDGEHAVLEYDFTIILIEA